MRVADEVIRQAERDPAVRRVRLVGSRARGDAQPESDWDLLVETSDFASVAAALPQLFSSLSPLAQQWDPLSDEYCWMLIFRGPVKVDLIFAGTSHAHAPPWEPAADNLAAVDAHFWDWLLWLRSKVAHGKADVVEAELRKLFDHLLRPLGVRRIPTSLADAVALYRPARAHAEERFEVAVPRVLEAEVAPALEGRARIPPWT